MSDRERIYLRSIRNPDKRAYGFDYANWCDRGASREEDPEPERPARLSYLGAQAVRLAINGFRAALTLSQAPGRVLGAEWSAQMATAEELTKKRGLLRRLKNLLKTQDQEAAHFKADALLLDYIDDPEIAAAYGRIPKWYA